MPLGWSCSLGGRDGCLTYVRTDMKSQYYLLWQPIPVIAGCGQRDKEFKALGGFAALSCPPYLHCGMYPIPNKYMYKM